MKKIKVYLMRCPHAVNLKVSPPQPPLPHHRLVPCSASLRRMQRTSRTTPTSCSSPCSASSALRYRRSLTFNAPQSCQIQCTKWIKNSAPKKTLYIGYLWKAIVRKHIVLSLSSWKERNGFGHGAALTATSWLRKESKHTRVDAAVELNVINADVSNCKLYPFC